MSPLVRAYLRTSSQRRRLLVALNACFDGVWLGLLDDQALRSLDQRFYEDRRETIGGRNYAYSDDAYNLQGFQDWEVAAIDEHFPPGSRVVVTGAGTGREVFALLERGFDAVGYEPNDRLREAGRNFLHRHGHPERLLPIERDAFPAEVDRCDAVVVGWGSYMLIPRRTRRVAFLQAARAVLPQGAPVLLSFFIRAEHGRYFQAVAGIANALRRLRRLEPVEYGDTLSPNYVHCFAEDEIDRELATAGFRLVRFAPEPYGHAVARAE